MARERRDVEEKDGLSIKGRGRGDWLAVSEMIT
jgi:hypothetical protein